MNRVTTQSSSPSPTTIVAGMVAGDERSLGAFYGTFGPVAYVLGA
jgi:hypothetical protein